MLFRKKEKEKKNMTTLEQVRKAYEDLADDDEKTFVQSISDRVHESIAAQEEDEGDKDTQSAEDREHEALGAEHADEERDEKRDEKREEEPEEEAEEAVEDHEEREDGTLKEILDKLAGIEARLAKIEDGKGKAVKEADEKDAKDLDKIASIYNS